MHDRTPRSDAATGAPSIEAGKPSGFRSLVGYRTVAWRDGYAEMRLELGPQHGNSIGITHGGVYMTVLDAALGHACTWCSVTGHVRRCVTVSLTTSFLAPALGRGFTAIGWLEAIENRIATARAEIVDDEGTTVAIAQGSFRYQAGSERLEGVPREPGTSREGS